ncbi:MAG TPA: bifunctional phosphopantothenoylcysteine decarboxylase/phosphopantothenate--cysteine ligase CoaBC, partial [Chloroflexota bacterium]|nr:bifunctional phosphopantothenoylcysteine decarboxylase/phosphopantothenate--cysteine ligase CoaBC [Chloroflexota bacterium]
MSDLRGRRILLGVTGSVAAFKAAVLASALTKAGAEVRVILTEAAEHFVAAETFSALTRHPVARSLWAIEGRGDLDHTELATWAELLVVAPASANTIARLAMGLADDMLSTVALATQAPVLIAPAMETHMWNHRATQANGITLRERGVVICGPVAGPLASGASGDGRMVEPDDLMIEIRRLLPDAGGLVQDLKGRRIVVGAGPTREPIDPVRFISNRSSGKMGYEIARAAYERGASVALISGPIDGSVAARLPAGVTPRYVETAEEMKLAITRAAREAEAVIMSAAVADFRPKNPSAKKMKKAKGLDSIALEPTDDILSALQTMAPNVVRVGFAAETEDLAQNAAEKLLKKGLAIVIANDVSGANGPIFGSDSNRVTIVRAGSKPEELPSLPKREVAHRILDYLVPLLS